MGTYFHRVRAVSGCDPTKSGPLSDVKRVDVIAAKPNVVFTVQPRALITALGERLEDRKGTFTIENISDTARWVALYRALESERPDAHFRDPYARRLAGEHGEAIARSMPA